MGSQKFTVISIRRI